jgi:hypothetical protein
VQFGKRGVVVGLEKIKDGDGEEFGDDADVIPIVEAVEHVDAVAVRAAQYGYLAQREAATHWVLDGSAWRNLLSTLTSTLLASLCDVIRRFASVPCVHAPVFLHGPDDLDGDGGARLVQVLALDDLAKGPLTQQMSNFICA